MHPLNRLHAYTTCNIQKAITLLQAEKEAGPLTREEQVGTWFSNPASDGKQTAQQTGAVGKYLPKAQPKNTGSDAGEGTAVPPPAKKARQAAYGNFDAW